MAATAAQVPRGPPPLVFGQRLKPLYITEKGGSTKGHELTMMEVLPTRHRGGARDPIRAYHCRSVPTVPGVPS